MTPKNNNINPQHVVNRKGQRIHKHSVELGLRKWRVWSEYHKRFFYRMEIDDHGINRESWCVNEPYGVDAESTRFRGYDDTHY